MILLQKSMVLPLHRVEPLLIVCSMVGVIYLIMIFLLCSCNQTKHTVLLSVRRLISRNWSELAQYVCVLFCLSICLSGSWFLCDSLCLSFFCPSVHVSVCLSICLPVVLLYGSYMVTELEPSFNLHCNLYCYICL